jgi:hypothetical protein
MKPDEIEANIGSKVTVNDHVTIGNGSIVKRLYDDEEECTIIKLTAAGLALIEDIRGIKYSIPARYCDLLEPEGDDGNWIHDPDMGARG